MTHRGPFQPLPFCVILCVSYTSKDAVQMEMAWSLLHFLGSPEHSLEQLVNCVNSCFHLILGMKIFINPSFQFVFLS